MKEKPKTKTERVARYMPLMYLIPLIMFVIAALIIIIVKESAKNVSPDEVVAKVNGYAITAQELSDRMSAEKSYIIEQYGKNQEINDDFWDKEINGVTPRSKLQNRALDVLKTYKVEQQVAVENKIIDKKNTSYTALINAMENENNLRSQKIASGQPVYGAKKYTKSTYFTYYYSNLQIENRNKLGSKGGALYSNNKTVKAWYDSVKNEKYTAFDTYDLTVYKIDLTKSNYDEKSARDIMQNVKSALESKESYDYIKNKICKDVIKLNTKIDDENASNLQKSAVELFEEMPSLNVGDISDVVSDESSIFVVVCDNRKDGGYKSYNTYKTAIYKEYIAEKYDEYIANRAKDAKVEKTDKFQYVK